jgi:hypothetical protein
MLAIVHFDLALERRYSRNLAAKCSRCGSNLSDRIAGMKLIRTASMLLGTLVLLGSSREAAAQQARPWTDVPNDTECHIKPYIDVPNDTECHFKPYIEVPTRPTHDFTLRIGHHTFGFREWAFGRPSGSTVFFGPLGQRRVPFTATQGLVGCGFILALMIVVPAALAARWKKRRPDRV